MTTRPESPNRPASVPIVVDLDDPLLGSDVIVESLFMLAKRRPAALLLAPTWLGGGAARFKAKLAEQAAPDARTLPYGHDLLARLRDEKQRGRSLVLATNADRAIGQAVAVQLGCFDAVLASEGETEPRGSDLAERVVAEFGRGGFDYACLGEPSPKLQSAARETIRLPRWGGDPKTLPVPSTIMGRLGLQGRAIRLSHWLKNGLVLLPLVASHRLFELATVAHAALAFAAFALCASAIYLLNDLLDLEEDRHHPYKSRRVLASGRLPLLRAALLVPPLLVAASCLSWLLPWNFALALGVYFVLMLAYCVRLRDIAYLDAATLGVGYTMRVLGGAAAAGLPVPSWLLAFCLPFFTGLALLKRYADLVTMRAAKGNGVRVHGYRTGDGPAIAAAGCSASGGSLLVLAGYFLLAIHPHGREQLLWLVPAALSLWLAHMWRMAARGRLVDDPVAFSLHDPTSLVTAAVSGIAILVAM
jgi:4-hydroxybenzoate polyprenyltransferase